MRSLIANFLSTLAEFQPTPLGKPTPRAGGQRKEEVDTRRRREHLLEEEKKTRGSGKTALSR
jgi:hypothetical protein